MGTSHRGLPPQIIVSITESQLRERAGIAHTTTGCDLPMIDVIQLAARSNMHLSVFDDITGEPLFHGRTRRLASQAQRFTLFAQYGGCSKPGCPAPFSHTEIHHAEHDWADGGRTDVTELAPACGPHNRAVGDGPGRHQTSKITAGPDRGRFGWHANGTTDPPATNHLHRPGQVLADTPPDDDRPPGHTPPGDRSPTADTPAGDEAQDAPVVETTPTVTRSAAESTLRLLLTQHIPTPELIRVIDFRSTPR